MSATTTHPYLSEGEPVIAFACEIGAPQDAIVCRVCAPSVRAHHVEPVGPSAIEQTARATGEPVRCDRCGAMLQGTPERVDRLALPVLAALLACLLSLSVACEDAPTRPSPRAHRQPTPNAAPTGQSAIPRR